MKLSNFFKITSITCLMFLGAGCQVYDPNEIVPTSNFNNEALGISFDYPNKWGELHFNEFIGDTGSTYLVESDLETSPISICGSSTDFSAPRGKFYCDYAKAFTEKDGNYYAFGEGRAQPFDIINTSSSKIIVLNSESVKCDGPLCSDGLPTLTQYFALVNLNSIKYPAGIFVFNSAKADYEQFKTLLKTIKTN
jgi:hypothetical protein